MVRTRQSLAVVGWFLVAGLAPPGVAVRGAVAAPAAPFSPTKVLAELPKKGAAGAGSWGRFDQTARPAVERSLAPYLVVVGEGQGPEERVPLKETTAEVTIAGVIARVQVRQLFENTGRAPLEAVYVFPASTRAAVHGVRMKIGARTIVAKIDKRAAARESYETARREGRRASLLEQERPNVFTMSVANVMPGDRVAVEMDYSELLVPDEGVYELVYPTVVGPRYPGGADGAKDTWMANPHLPAGTPEPYRFDIKVHLETGIGIKELSSPSHQVAVKYAGAARADVTLAAAGGGNRDFVLRYRLAGEKIESGVLLWEGDGGAGRREGFFALMMEPPQRPALAQIPAREFIFLLDVSGSMNGFPLDTAKTLMRNLLGRLRPTDTFNVGLFAGAGQVLFPAGSVPARKAAIDEAVVAIERQRGGGGTELMGGLEMCYRIPRRDPNVSRTVVVVTDGFVGVEAQAFRFIRERASEANLFAFGIGSSVNRGLIEGMARAGQGEPFVVLNADKAASEADKLRAYIEQPVLARVNVSFAGFDAYEVAPQSLPDLMARRPLVLYGKYRGEPSGRIEVSGVTGGGVWRQAVDVRASDVRAENAALRWLWARRWVDTLEDERAMGAGKSAEDGITSLGLDYKLLTAFTSFVAIDSQVVNAGGQQQVRQPLPLPDGVSDLAVGDAVLGGLRTIGQGGGGTGYGRVLHGLQAPTAVGRRHAAEAGKEAKMGKALRADTADLHRVSAPRAVSEGEAKSEAAAATPSDRGPADKPKGLRWTVTVGKVSALGDAAPLVKAIEKLLAASAGCPASTRAQPIMLRVTVDARGKVTGVEVLRDDGRRGGCLVTLLAGVSSATNATPGATGTVELTISAR